jgi:transcription antitermination factor NusG
MKSLGISDARVKDQVAPHLAEVDKIMKRIESDQPRLKVTFQLGEQVRIIDGPFA